MLASCNQWGSVKRYVVVVVHLFSVAKSCPTLWPHGLQHAKLFCPPLSHRVFSNSCLSRQWCYQTISSSVVPFSFCLHSFPASGFFPNESALCIRWPEYWSFSCSINSSNKYLGLITFRVDWLDLLAVQGTLKSLPKNPGVGSLSFLQEELPSPGIELGSPALQGGSLPAELPGKPVNKPTTP